MGGKGYAGVGKQLIADMQHSTPSLPLQPWTDFALRFTVEYPAHHFEEEAGFWAAVMGQQFLSLNEDYAICTDAAGTYTFSFRKSDTRHDLQHLRIQWFTDGLDRVLEELTARGQAYDLIRHSDNQRYARFHSPSGMPVEVWSGWEQGGSAPKG